MDSDYFATPGGAPTSRPTQLAKFGRGTPSFARDTEGCCVWGGGVGRSPARGRWRLGAAGAEKVYNIFIFLAVVAVKIILDMTTKQAGEMIRTMHL